MTAVGAISLLKMVQRDDLLAGVLHQLAKLCFGAHSKSHRKGCIELLWLYLREIASNWKIEIKKEHAKGVT